jgi:hypothetical protein
MSFINVYDGVINHLKSHSITWLLAVLCSVVSYQLFYVVKNPPEIKEFKDGVQNHLVWSIKGDCFFVRPQTEQTVFLVRVVDCDKK